MSSLVVDYTLDTLHPANPDGTLPATVVAGAIIGGPGATTLGTFAEAIDFSAGAHFETKLPLAALDAMKFCARCVFRIDSAPTQTQILLASDAIPFSLSIVPGSDGSDFHLVAAVTTVSGPGAASTRYLATLKAGTWYTGDLVFDTDTVAVYVDGAIVSVSAFPAGTLTAGSGDRLIAGVDLDGTSDPFTGALAAMQLHADIPIEIEAMLDERRTHPQWFLTYKEREIAPTLAFGERVGEFYFDLASASWMQDFKSGILMYTDANGQAFEMHGAILDAYRALPNRSAIGYLVSDEIASAKAGGRRSLFNRGGFYWSPKTGAVPVLGQLWVDYENLGESGVLGWPRSAATPVPAGSEQIFEGARMYLRAASTRAFEVHGGILAKYLALGGPAAIGFPVGNESDVMAGTAAIGRVSEFERATIWWSAATGAFEVHGDIRDKYRNLQGPGGVLGFPTSDEHDIPNASGAARYNTFTNGSILWFGDTSQMNVCTAFDISLQRVDTKESEGWGRGQNDVYMHATIDDNGHVLLSERIPDDGDSDGNNAYEVDKTFDLGGGIVPNDPNRRIRFVLDVWDSDWPDDDDHLGTFDHTLEMANAWGLRENPVGVFDSGSFDNINSIKWSVSPHIDPQSLSEDERWWGATNVHTDPLTYEQYASAFSDVDSDPEWWDPTDWLSKLFYEAVVKGLAKHGNCFGMSLAAIYSKKGQSYLREPLNRFKDSDWETIREEFNIKHQYQVGAPAIWWFVGEFLSGKTHDPVSVFKATRDAFNSGCDPVLCIAQNYDFGGAPHCILPVAWDDSAKPWRITLHDPNFPSGDTGAATAMRDLLVDPDENTFSYVGSDTYSGGTWSGGRLHYMPFDLVNERPRTPVFEAIMLLITGVIIILGADAETDTLTDENGVDLDAFGADAVARLQAGQSIANKFVSVKGFNAHRPDCAKERPGDEPQQPTRPRRPRPHGVLTCELHLRSERKTFSRETPPNRRDGSDWTRVTLREYLCQFAPADVRRAIERHESFIGANRNRLVHYLLDEAPMKDIIGAALGKKTGGVGLAPTMSKNFVHTVRGLRRGGLEYAVKQGMTEFVLRAPASTGEVHRIAVKDLGASTSEITIEGARDKMFSLEINNRLGTGRDMLRMTVDRIPLTGGGALRINIKPGIGGIELYSAGQKIEATVSFEYRGRGTRLASTFALAGDDGVRIVPSTFLTSNRLRVSRIDTLFGAAKSSMLVPAIV